MTEGDLPRDRLAARMRARRIALRLTATDAAVKAGVARNTWSDAEKAARDIQTTMYAGIETTLRWEAGSVERILAGGEPTELPAAPAVDVVRPPVRIDLDYELDRVRALDIPPRTKLRLIQALIELAAQTQEAEAEQGSPHSAR